MKSEALPHGDEDAASDASPASPGALVDVGGYSLHIVRKGVGSPTVVMDAGLGGTSLDWSRVVPQVAERVRVCVYDRAGYAWSDAGPRPRTSRQIVRELHTLLQRAGIPAPYVLVGHSFGGLNVRLFAAEYPDEVAGLVLVDASHEDLVARLGILARFYEAGEIALLRLAVGLSRLGLGHVLLRTDAFPFVRRVLAKYPDDVRPLIRGLLRSARFWRTMCAEDVAYAESCAEVRGSARSLGARPLLVLARETLRGGIAGPIWQAAQADLASLSTCGKLILVPDTGHYIHLEHPEVVIAAISEVVAAVRAQANAGWCGAGAMRDEQPGEG